MDKTDFAGELESLLNRHSMENASDTPAATVTGSASPMAQMEVVNHD